MRRFMLLLIDLGLACLASLFSLFVRENFDVGTDRFLAFLPYLVATMAWAAVVFLSFGLNRTIWRFSSRPEYVRIITASTAIVVGAVSLTFAYNRLEGVARALPVLQLLSCQAFLIGARVLHKISHESRQSRKASATFLHLAERETRTTVLIVGITRLTEVYLQAVSDFAAPRISVAGLLGQTSRHVGRLVATHPVLGRPSDIEDILRRLDVHGVVIDCIVIASPFHALGEEDRAVLLRVERSRAIPLQFLTETLGFDAGREPLSSEPASAVNGCARHLELSFEISPAELDAIAKRRYWASKRAVDFVAALLLLIVCAPFMAAAGVLVAANVGFPVLFWQQRPGLGGRPFRLYKFRTMKAAHAPDGRRLSDKERVSRLGDLMRRIRFDELPQIFSILRGDMCFIGPRPLLASEQPEAYRARLLVRPGLTGWAQVVGGRNISPEVKAALDVWYVRNANWTLDLKIALKTIPMLFFGESISRPLIERAWRDLSEGGVLKGELARNVENGLQVGSFPL